VFRQEIVAPTDSQSFNFSIVNFTAGSRNKFHQHTSDQILIVTEGTGVVATDQEEKTVTAGDVVLIPAGENHWHGAPGATPMSHITIQVKGSQTQQNEP
jgi:quercetin dioxygenase-like cupin family protein